MRLFSYQMFIKTSTMMCVQIVLYNVYLLCFGELLLNI